MASLFQDVRYGLRVLQKNPGFTAAAVITLALGIGVNTAIFSLISGILLRPLPYSQPDRLVRVTGFYPRGAFAFMKEQSRTMDLAGFVDGVELNLSGQSHPVRLTGASVSAECFSILGTQPMLGRAFEPGEDSAGQDALVLLSYGLWQQRFGGSPQIVGGTIRLEGVERRVIGIMRPGFHFPSSATQFWVPLHLDPRNVGAYWGADYMPVIGRLRPAATVNGALAEVRAFIPELRSLFPWKMAANWNADASVISLQEDLVGDARSELLVLFAAVGLIMLIACANVANLFLSRAVTRGKDIAVRIALGAGRSQIMRHLLTESVQIVILGGLAGLLLAVEGLPLLKHWLPADTPRLGDVDVDLPVLLFTALLTILTWFICSISPILTASQPTMLEPLKSGGQRSVIGENNRLRNSLAVGQVALAVVLTRPVFCTKQSESLHHNS